MKIKVSSIYIEQDFIKNELEKLFDFSLSCLRSFGFIIKDIRGKLSFLDFFRLSLFGFCQVTAGKISERDE